MNKTRQNGGEKADNREGKTAEKIQQTEKQQQKTQQQRKKTAGKKKRRGNNIHFSHKR
jgi:hypothetical protein